MRVIAGETIATDEDLMQSVASGRQEAIGPLYSRYAPTVLRMAAQASGRVAASRC